jgi:hypothetical protein
LTAPTLSLSVIPHKLQDNLDALEVQDRFHCAQLAVGSNCVEAVSGSVALTLADRSTWCVINKEMNNKLLKCEENYLICEGK